MSDTATPSSRPSLPRPVIHVRFPDTRSLIVTGIFGLTVYMIHLLAGQPALGDNKLFFALAVAIGSSSVGAIVGFYFGASKGGASVLENQNPPAQQP